MNIHALKNICGSVYLELTGDLRSDIAQNDWQYLAGYLNIPITTAYSIELRDNGFDLVTKAASLRYIHADAEEQRSINVW